MKPRRMQRSITYRPLVGLVASLPLVGAITYMASTSDAHSPANGRTRTGSAESVSARSSFAIAPEFPVDVDIAEVDRLDAKGPKGIVRAQRLFDTLSWQAFLALNWPAKPNGQPDAAKGLTNHGPRVWDYWRTGDTIFLPQGAKPAPWNPKRMNKGAESLFRDKAAWRQNTTSADENFQAFSGPLIDQNGNWVRYEVLVNRPEFDYIYANKLYNLEGQAAFSQRFVRGNPKANQMDLPINHGKEHGAIEIKLAWKQLVKGKDDFARFYTTNARVMVANPSPSGKPIYKTIPVGLVGMHIAMHTASSPQWIWATFEQIDNAPEGPPVPSGTRAHYNFYNSAKPGAPVNTLAPKNAVIDPKTGLPVPEPDPSKATTWIESETTEPTQLTRLPVPYQEGLNPLDASLAASTAQLNRIVQAKLRARGSVFQYYKLIGTQWPVHPSAPAVAGGSNSAPASIRHKTPGDMVPVFLINTTMESFFQKGKQPAGPLEQDDRLDSSAPPIDSTPVIGTESCVGCHYSAGICIGFKKDDKGNLLRDPNGRVIPIIGQNNHMGWTGGANFSWMFQIEARSTHDPKPKPNPAQFLDIGSHPGMHTLPSKNKRGETIH